MKTTWFWMLPLAAGLGSLSAGCDWRKLDKAVEGAPVLSVGAPSGYSANDVGRLIAAVPLANPSDVSSRFFMAGTEQTSAALVELNPQGKPTSYNVPGSVFLGKILGQRFTSLAAFSDDPSSGSASVLLGMANRKDETLFELGQVARLRINADRSFSLEEIIDPPPGLNFVGTGVHFGTGVAAGHVTGQPNISDWVVVSDTAVTLYVDGVITAPLTTPPTPAANCLGAATSLSGERFYRNSRNPAIGEFIPGVRGIAVGVTGATGGSLVFVTHEAGATALTCPLTIPMPGVPSFGTSVAAGDVDGDGDVDLVVGAPALVPPATPAKVFVFLGPFDPDPTKPRDAPIVIQAPAGAENALFGARLALADLDGKPGLEIAVAAPKFSGDVEEGGAVFLFNAAGVRISERIVNNQPVELAHFGEGLAFVPFTNLGCPQGGGTPLQPPVNLLVAGADEEVFTFFHLPNLSIDPRCL